MPGKRDYDRGGRLQQGSRGDMDDSKLVAHPAPSPFTNLPRHPRQTEQPPRAPGHPDCSPHITSLLFVPQEFVRRPAGHLGHTVLRH